MPVLTILILVCALFFVVCIFLIIALLRKNSDTNVEPMLNLTNRLFEDKLQQHTAQFENKLLQVVTHFTNNTKDTIHQIFDSKHKNQLEITENILTNKLTQSDAILSNKLQQSSNTLATEKDKLVHTVLPISETLIQLNQKIEKLEKGNLQNISTLVTQMQALQSETNNLNKETTKLSQALRKPEVRGKWGELQLKRVLEIAGMRDYCDFSLQTSINDTENNKFRPDAIINIPGDRCIVIDSKVPLEAYLDATSTDDVTEQNRLLQHHSTKVRERVKELSDKTYWSKLSTSPDFVVLFLPSENLFSSALDYDPQLIEYGTNKNVLIATPTTLIALLKSIAYGWNQKRLEENYTGIIELASELYARLSTMSEHFDKVGKNLTGATTAYNDAIGSFESRVLSTARKIKDLGVSSDKNLKEFSRIENTVRPVKHIDFKE
ncbi:DNA recombination protein RmuC [Candidatus Hepatincola sp. Av]